MTCGSCSAGIEKHLNSKPYVVSANVNLIAESAEIRYHPQESTPHQLVEDVQSIGFHANITDTGQAPTVLTLEFTAPLPDPSHLLSLASTWPGIRSADITGDTAMTFDFFPDAKARELLAAIEDEGLSFKLAPPTRYSSSSKATAERAATLKKLFKISVALTVPVVLLHSLVPHFETFWLCQQLMSEPIAGVHLTLQVLLLFLLVTPIQLVVGRVFYAKCFSSLSNGQTTMDVLIALGTSAAYLYSIGSMALMVLREDYRGHTFFETCAMLITFVLFGRILEHAAKERTTDAIAHLVSLQPSTALLVDKMASGPGGQQVDVRLLRPGDCVKVLAGEKVPVDGVVATGVAAVDEAMITGESRPVDKSLGHMVIGGTVCVDGSFVVEATQVGSSSMLQQMVGEIEKAQASKAPIQDYANKIAAVFVPIVIVLGVLTTLFWLVAAYFFQEHVKLLPGTEPVSFSLMFGIAVVVVACPCALGLATPTAVMVATGVGGRHGVPVSYTHLTLPTKRIV
eukprot:TRINITY_DN51142_c0_g1_i1.p1 TRINITY_DN51142_c0_g1~~TRINITY_DN51142_c0_g1_i1.p1  ORF type:complete len:512 (+),score=142.99 TRINITY_DN51142_c0_g1_i1:189-1724(+)